MIEDLTGYGLASDIEADLCIVGAGAAGIAIAQAFLGSDLRVLLLESGGRASEHETDRLKEGETDGMAPAGLTEGRARGLGGTTTLWAGQCVPMDPIDFEPREWVPHSGWPIGLDDLAPFYERAADLFAVGGESYDEQLWSRWDMSPPAMDPTKIGHTYTVWSPRPDLGRNWARELRRSANVRVLLHANVTGIDAGPNGRAFERLTVSTLNGQTAQITARACVLCAGTVENARLLLTSGDLEAGGLGNTHDNVGRFFQEHPNGRCAILRTSHPERLQEPYSLFYRRGRRYLPKLVLAPEVQRSEQVLNCGANFQYEFEDEGLNAMRRLYRSRRGGQEPSAGRRDLRLALRAVPSAARSAYRRFVLGRSSSAPAAAIALQTHSEQAPNPDSRIRLSRERDALGVPRARIEWRLTDLERRTAETMARTVASELGRLGIAEAELPAWLTSSQLDWTEHLGDSYHHLGTTRMSDNPRDGVVDRDCEVHGVAGLYVAGGSVFPTSGFANPTFTLAALALRLADRLTRRLASGGGGPTRLGGARTGDHSPQAERVAEHHEDLHDDERPSRSG